MEIQKTINYFQFKHIESNRPVDQKHVNALIDKIKLKNLLHLFPILVNPKMEVIDGQHRLAAAERLGDYIYYVIDEHISKADISSVNMLSKSWKVEDYINYWTVEQKPGFDMLSQFMIANPLIPPSTVLRMVGPGTGGNSTMKLREGIVDVSNIEQANVICDIVKEYSGFIDFAYERHFVLAVINCVHTPAYDHEQMKLKYANQKRSFVKCVSVKKYKEMLEEIYNYQSSKNRIKIKC